MLLISFLVCFVIFGNLFQRTAEKWPPFTGQFLIKFPQYWLVKHSTYVTFKNVSVLGDINIKTMAVSFPSPVGTLWATLFAFQCCPHLQPNPWVFLLERKMVAFIVSHFTGRATAECSRYYSVLQSLTMSQVPWAESSTVVGRPLFLSETQRADCSQP